MFNLYNNNLLSFVTPCSTPRTRRPGYKDVLHIKKRLKTWQQDYSGCLFTNW